MYDDLWLYKAEVLKLRQELARLKSMMLAHRDCPVTRQQQKMMAGSVFNEMLIYANSC